MPNENREAEPNLNHRATELVRNREVVAQVENWIDEFKLRGTQECHATAAEYSLKARTTIQG